MAASRRPAAASVDGTVEARADLSARRARTFNVAGLLEGGRPGRRDEIIVVGAHHDHLGTGGPGSGSRKPDTTAVHPGADDNASGAAALVELAGWLAAKRPARSVLFIAFGAEELGAAGSRHFTEHPLVGLDRVCLMVNLDMIGRLSPDSVLQVGGTGTSPTHEARLAGLNAPRRFRLATFPEGYGPSDQSSFYARDIPVLFFSTGAHPDYHTPSDRPESVRFDALRDVVRFVGDFVLDAADREERPVFREAGPKVRRFSGAHGGAVTFGLMPDVLHQGTDGMPVRFVTPGHPAAAAGMRAGDRITAVEGKPVGNVYDYAARLRSLREGQSVVVTVSRDGTSLDLLLKL
jgi:hypothetical protein